MLSEEQRLLCRNETKLYFHLIFNIFNLQVSYLVKCSGSSNADDRPTIASTSYVNAVESDCEALAVDGDTPLTKTSFEDMPFKAALYDYAKREYEQQTIFLKL